MTSAVPIDSPAEAGSLPAATPAAGSPGLPTGSLNRTPTLAIRSALPNRLRVELPQVRRDEALATGVAQALRALPGVTSASVSALTGRALLLFAEPIQNLDATIEAIRVAAAGAEPIDPASLAPAGDASLAERPVPVQRDWLRVITGGVVVGGLLLVRVVGGAALLGSPPVALLATGAALAVGLPTFMSGLRPLLRFEAPEIDTLITTATFASLLAGEPVTGLVVVWLIALGELVEELTIDRTRRAIADLLAVGEEYAWVVVGGESTLLASEAAASGQADRLGQAAEAHGGVSEARILVDEIQPGAVVVVHAGEKIPVDGVVLRGAGPVNQAPITGESLPVFRNPGDDVFAGTVLESGALLVRATRVGADTTIGRIIRMVEEARDVQAPVQRLADRFSRRIVPLSFLLAGGVFALTGNVLRSMTILVIACPCAAGLATPTAVSAAIASAARRGVLIKGGLHLETAGGVDAVVFDKTGTLTAGAPRVTRVQAVDERYSPERVLALAASGELHSQHPLASAVLQHTEEREIEIPPHSEYEIIVGHGVRFAVDGTRLVIGSRHMLQDFAVPVPAELDAAAQRLRAGGETVLWVAEAPDGGALAANHEVQAHPEREALREAVAQSARPPAATAGRRVIGMIGVADVVRPEAAEALAALRAAGVKRIEMITGDSRESALLVADHLGIPPESVVAEALPEAKFDLVRRLQAEGYRVALVGDGVNDAPALAAADVGIAMGHGGADVALEAADIALAADDVRQVAEVINLSGRTMQLVRQNFAASLGINGIGVVAGALGLLSPFAAAVVHNVSTVAVVLNSGRLLSWSPPRGSSGS